LQNYPVIRGIFLAGDIRRAIHSLLSSQQFMINSQLGPENNTQSNLFQ